MLFILESFFVQMVFVFGFVILCGMFISFCNKCLYDACGDAAFSIVRLTGYIGTPVHELSHALMCLLFGHNITKMKLVNTDRRSKTLGYVEHTYYKTNLYHQIGNYFIGISPILAGGAVTLLFVWIFVPNMLSEMMGELGGSLGLENVPRVLAEIWSVLFAKKNFADIRYWIALIFSLFVVIHMEISRSDIRSGLRGLGVLAAMLLIADVILGLMFPNALAVFTAFCVKIGIGSLLFLLLPLAVSALIGLVSISVLTCRAMFGKKARSVAVNHHRVSSSRTQGGKKTMTKKVVKK